MSLADETPEGRSIVALAHGEYNIPPSDPEKLHATVIPFTAETRVSRYQPSQAHGIKRRVGCDCQTAPIAWVRRWIANVKLEAEKIARTGGTPLVVAENDRTLGVIHPQGYCEARNLSCASLLFAVWELKAS